MSTSDIHDSMSDTRGPVGYSVTYLAVVAIMTALTAVVTMVIAIPFPTSTGYLNVGDVLVMTSGILLGPIGGLVAGGVGSMIADVALGYVYFAPVTLVVKGTEGLLVGVVSSRSSLAERLTVYDVAGIVLGALAMLMGYYLGETHILLMTPEAALAELVSVNVFQVVAGGIVTGAIGPKLRAFVRPLIRYETSPQQ